MGDDDRIVMVEPEHVAMLENAALLLWSYMQSDDYDCQCLNCFTRHFVTATITAQAAVEPDCNAHKCCKDALDAALILKARRERDGARIQ